MLWNELKFFKGSIIIAMQLKEAKNPKFSLFRWLKSHKKDLIIALIIVLYCAVINLFMQYVQRYDFDNPIISSLEWVIHYPVAFLINCLFVFTFSAFVWLLCRRAWISVLVVGAVSVIFCLANYFKLTIRGEPVYPGDLLFQGEITNIIGATKLIVPSSVFAFLAVVVVLVVAAFFVKSPKVNIKKRMGCILSILAVWLLAFLLFFTNTTGQKIIGIEDAIWNQRHNYLKNGMYNAFFMQTRYLIVDKPKGYSKKKAQELLASEKTSNLIGNTPNVIVIMTESFWDPTRLPGVKFDVNPMEGFDKVKAESTYGNLLVEPFGGNTANTEFEVLTGFSMNTLPGGVAYQQYLKKPVPSLPSLLKAQGYSTQAIHPYHKWFWNRKVAYPLLGMDDFLGIESFNDTETKGKYISDMAVGDKIISQYEANISSGKPFFVHAVTMQNHGWYETGRYGDNQTVHASSGQLDDKAIQELNTYSQGVKDASDSIYRLVDFFKKINEPTEIIFFGDHLPTLGWNYLTYRKTGYVSQGDLTATDTIKLHQVPFIMWSNTDTSSQDVGTINANYLVPVMLKRAGITMSEYFSFLDSKMLGATSCNKSVCLNETGNLIDVKSRTVAGKLTDQAILQYYYLFD